jgi:hypothetical protein
MIDDMINDMMNADDDPPPPTAAPKGRATPKGRAAPKGGAGSSAEGDGAATGRGPKRGDPREFFIVKQGRKLVGDVVLRDEKRDDDAVWAAVATCYEHGCVRQRVLHKGCSFRWAAKWILDGLEPKPERASSSSSSSRRPAAAAAAAQRPAKHDRDSHMEHSPERFREFTLPKEAGLVLERDRWDVDPNPKAKASAKAKATAKTSATPKPAPHPKAAAAGATAAASSKAPAPGKRKRN